MLWTLSPRFAATMDRPHRPHRRRNPLAVAALLLTVLLVALPQTRCSDAALVLNRRPPTSRHLLLLNPPPAGLRDDANIFVTPETSTRGKRTIDILLQGLAEALGYELRPRLNGTSPRRQQKPPPAQPGATVATPPAASPKQPPLSPKPPAATKVSMAEEVTPKGANASDSDLQAQREHDEDERSHEDLKEEDRGVGVDDYFRDTAGQYFRKEYDRIKASERNPPWGNSFYDEDDKEKVPAPAKRDEERDENYYQYFLPVYSSAPTAGSDASVGGYPGYHFAGSASDGHAPKYTFTAPSPSSSSSSEGPYYVFGQPASYSFEIPYQTTISQQQQELQPQEQRNFQQGPEEQQGTVELLPTLHPLHTQALFVPATGAPAAKDPKVLSSFKASFAGRLPISSTSKPQMAQILQEMEGTRQDSLWPPPFDYAFDSTDASIVADKPAAIVQQHSVVGGKSSAQLVAAAGPTQWPAAGGYHPGERVLSLVSPQQPAPLFPRPTESSPANLRVAAVGNPRATPSAETHPRYANGPARAEQAGSNHGPPLLPLAHSPDAEWVNAPQRAEKASSNHGPPLLPLAHSPDADWTNAPHRAEKGSSNHGPPLLPLAPSPDPDWVNAPHRAEKASSNHRPPLLPLAHSPAPYYPPISSPPNNAPPSGPDTASRHHGGGDGGRSAHEQRQSKNAEALRNLGWPTVSNKTAAAIRNEAATSSLAKALSWFDPSTAALLDPSDGGAPTRSQKNPREKTKTTTEVEAYVGIVVPFLGAERRAFSVAEATDGLAASPTSPVAIKAAAPEREYSYPSPSSAQRIDTSRASGEDYSKPEAASAEYSYPQTPQRIDGSRASGEDYSKPEAASGEYSYPQTPQRIDGSRASGEDYSKPEAASDEYSYPQTPQRIDASRASGKDYSKPEAVSGEYSYPQTPKRIDTSRAIGKEYSKPEAASGEYSYPQTPQRIDTSRAIGKDYSKPEAAETPSSSAVSEKSERQQTRYSAGLEKPQREQTRYQQTALYGVVSSTTEEPSSFYRPQIVSSPKPFTRPPSYDSSSNAVFGKESPGDGHKPSYPFYAKDRHREEEQIVVTTVKPYIPPANHYGIRLPPSTTTTTTTPIPPRSREAATHHKQRNSAAPPTDHYGIRLPPPPPPRPLRRPRPRPLTREEEARRHHVEFLRHPHHPDDYDHRLYEDYPEVAGVRYLFEDDDEQEGVDEESAPQEDGTASGPRWRPGPPPGGPPAAYEPPEGARDFYRPPAHASNQQQQFRHPHSSFSVQGPLSDDYTSLDYYFADPPAVPRYRRPRPSARLAMREAEEAAEAVKKRSEAYNTPPPPPPPTGPAPAAAAAASEALAPTAVIPAHAAGLSAPSTSKSLSKEVISRVSKLHVTGKVHFYPDEDDGLEGKVGLRKR